MKFETSEEIRARKEAAGKSSQQEEKRKAKAAAKANQKYARMAEESAKREAAAKKKAEAKPKLVVDRSHVITAPALLAATPKPTKGPEFEAALKKAIEKVNAEPKSPSQVWDAVTKQWVKR